MLRIVMSGLAAAMLLTPPAVSADEMSSSEILQRLQAQRQANKRQNLNRQGTTRTLSIVDDASQPAPKAGAAAAKAPNAADSVVIATTPKSAPATKVSVDPGVASVATPPPVLDESVSIDLEILFDFDSARLRPAAKSQLAKLCKALASDSGEGTYQVIGHTDAAGSFDYNLTLSRARAAEVVRFLSGDECGLPRKRFVAMGMGEQRLKRPEMPRSAENRRVEIQISG